LTTGLAYIYGSAEAMAVEPGYIHKRHEPFRSSTAGEGGDDAVEGGDE
jgi:hypothetical protein